MPGKNYSSTDTFDPGGTRGLEKLDNASGAHAIAAVKTNSEHAKLLSRG